MKFCNCLILCLSIAIGSGADKKDAKFSPEAASSYPSKQTIDKVTIAAVAYDSADKNKEAFGKMKPYEHGVLPVLVVIQNDSGKALKLDRMQVEYIGPDRSHIEATPPADVPYLQGGRRPKIGQSPIPSGAPRIKGRKNPLSGGEIEARAFSAKMLPPGDSANGFFYFQTGHRPGAKLYITGISEAATGKELFYFEIPLEAQ